MKLSTSFVTGAALLLAAITPTFAQLNTNASYL